MDNQKELEEFVRLAARDSFINPFEELSEIKVKANILLKNINERKKQNVKSTSCPNKRSKFVGFRILKRG